MKANVGHKLISVVIPVHNTKQYLPACFESVLRQSYELIEILLIDDGSTDGSSELCDQLVSTDRRARVFHKENGGPSAARNYGIEKASGVFITFIDSDDYVSSNFIETLYDCAILEDADIVSCPLVAFYDSGGEMRDNDNEWPSHDDEIMTPSTALKAMLGQTDRRVTAHACGKLYRKRLFNSIRFPEGKLYEDLGTTYLCLGSANKIVATNSSTYFYRQHAGSITHSKFDLCVMDMVEFSHEILEYIRKEYPENEDVAIFRAFAVDIYILSKIPFRRVYGEQRRQISKEIKKYRRYIIANKKSNKVHKFYAGVSYIGGTFTVGIIARTKSRIGQNIRKMKEGHPCRRG